MKSRASVVAFFVFFLCFWGIRYADFLFQAQESGFFSTRAAFLASSVSSPGGGLAYATSFATSLCYYPLLGAAILAAALVAIQRLGARLSSPNGVPGRAAELVALVPPVILALLASWRGYAIYVPFEPAATFAPIFGTLFAFAVAVAYFRFVAPTAKAICGVVCVGVGYPLVGAYALLAALLI
ncbi:MAG: hypothetical protein HUK22_06595, partial [Thermoguttaceae bacterium]|nr:hypothetical protein [Thermoguttaceae bacterium]